MAVSVSRRGCLLNTQRDAVVPPCSGIAVAARVFLRGGKPQSLGLPGDNGQESRTTPGGSMGKK